MKTFKFRAKIECHFWILAPNISILASGKIIFYFRIPLKKLHFFFILGAKIQNWIWSPFKIEFLDKMMVLAPVCWIEMECECVWLGYSFMSQRGYLIFIGPIMGQDSAHGSDLQLSFIFGISSSHRSCGCTRFTQNQWWFHLYLYQPVFSIPDTLLRLTALKKCQLYSSGFFIDFWCY